MLDTTTKSAWIMASLFSILTLKQIAFRLGLSDVDSEEISGVVWIEIMFIVTSLILIYFLKKARETIKIEYFILTYVLILNVLVICHMQFNPSKESHEILLKFVLLFSNITAWLCNALGLICQF